MYYILISNDSFTLSGTTKPAIEIIRDRLKHGRWPLYKSTGHLKKINIGDKCLLYVAGRQMYKQSFVTFFKIQNIENKKLLDVDNIKINISNPKPVIELIFKRINNIKYVPIKDFLDILDYTKKRKSNKWGSLMMGGVKKISKKDFEIIKNKL